MEHIVCHIQYGAYFFPALKYDINVFSHIQKCKTNKENGREFRRNMKPNGYSGGYYVNAEKLAEEREQDSVHEIKTEI